MGSHCSLLLKLKGSSAAASDKILLLLFIHFIFAESISVKDCHTLNVRLKVPVANAEDWWFL